MPSQKRGSENIKNMFSSIAKRYDLLNRLLSFGVDVRWRRKLASQMPSRSQGAVLDLATGTGDVMLTLDRCLGDSWRIIGADFTMPMLKVAKVKLASRGSTRLHLTAGDAMSMPFADSAFKAVTIAFGLRNLPDRAWALGEILRVLAPGGRLIILEFSPMDHPVTGAAFRFYFHRVLPFLGGIISGNPGAYRYLPRSVDDFPNPTGLDSEMEEAGFTGVRHIPLTWGVAFLHVGSR